MAENETTENETEAKAKRDGILNVAVAAVAVAVKAWHSIVTGKEAREQRRNVAVAIVNARECFERTLAKATYRGKEVTNVTVPDWTGATGQYRDWYKTNVTPVLEDAIPDFTLRRAFTSSLQKDVQDEAKRRASQRERELLGLTDKSQKEQAAENKAVDGLLSAVPGAKRATARRILREQDGDVAKATAELRKESPITPEDATSDSPADGETLTAAFGTLDYKTRAQVLVQSAEAFRDDIKKATADDGEGVPAQSDIGNLMETLARLAVEIRTAVSPAVKTGVKVTAPKAKAKAS